jgi:glycosyltransferase involved in cell wall biosynthesis
VKVGIDVAPLVHSAAGTARWVRGLTSELERRAEVDVHRFTWGGTGRLAVLARDLAWYPILLPRAASAARVDILHCTIYRGPLRSRVPTIVTVHDLAVLRHPELFRAWTRLYGRTALGRTVRSSRRVIAVSELARREVAELCGVDPGRIDVVPNGVDSVFSSTGPAAEGDYVLAVGTLEPRKNLPRVIEAARLAGAELRVVGARGWGGVAAEGAGVRWLGRVPDDELAALYRGARCLVYPSLYEGFGIPVVEAMACGTPVVTSTDSAMAEVAGSAAVLVDPLDPGSIAAGIAEAEASAEELRRLGLERAALYTWSRAADAALSSYERAAA